MAQDDRQTSTNVRGGSKRLHLAKCVVALFWTLWIMSVVRPPLRLLSCDVGVVPHF